VLDDEFRSTSSYLLIILPRSVYLFSRFLLRYQALLDEFRQASQSKPAFPTRRWEREKINNQTFLNLFLPFLIEYDTEIPAQY